MKREVRCLAPRAHRLTPLVCPACAGGKGGASKSPRKLKALKATRAKRWPMMDKLRQRADVQAEVEEALQKVSARAKRLLATKPRP